MLQYIALYYFLTLVTSGFANIYISNPFSFEIDQCKDICSDSFFLLPLGQDSQSICQRGCRFFNLIDIKEERSINDTNKECHNSCAESYTNSKEMGSCTIGCDTMSKKKQSDLHKFFPYLEQYTTDEQEFDSLEADILLDPLIRKQVQMGYDLQYKIPEAYIRTMPIDDNIELIDTDDMSYKSYNRNLICSSLLPLSIFVMLLCGFIMCSFKIVQLAQEIKYKTADTPEELDKIILKYEEGGTCFMHNCKHFKYNLYEIPGVAFIIPEEKKVTPPPIDEKLTVANK